MDVDSRTAGRPSMPPGGVASLPDLIAAARRGCPRALGQVFEALRAQLVLVAEEALPDGLRAKIAPSDLVQETAIDMQRTFDQFRGSSAEECFAWLRAILRHNAVDAVRHFKDTHKRAIAREERLGADRDGDDAVASADDRRPERSAIRREDAAVVTRMLARVPAEHRQVIELRYWRGLSFGEIGAEMNRSPDAVRRLWYRALERLQMELAAEHRAGISARS